MHRDKVEYETKNLPVIMCTGNDNLELAMHQQCSPNDVLYKPFDVDALVDMVAFQLAA